MPLFFLALFCFTPVFAQVKSGKLVYTTYTESNSGDQPPVKTRFAIEFNDQLICYGKEDDDGISCRTLENKATKTNTYCYLDSKKKHMQFFFDEQFTEEITQNYHFRYGPYDQEDSFDIGTGADGRSPGKDTIVVESDETKTIIGFVCRKAILKIRNEQTWTIWYTPEITGLENLFELGNVVKGTVLSYTSEDRFGSHHADAVELDKSATFAEKDLFIIPEGYYLRLKPVYVYSDLHYVPIEEQLRTPSFLSFGSPKEIVQRIISEMDKSITVKDPEFPGTHFNVSIFFDEKGTVSRIVFDNEADDKKAKFNKTQLINEITQHCSLKEPATLYGKAVPVELKINYSHYEEF